MSMRAHGLVSMPNVFGGAGDTLRVRRRDHRRAPRSRGSASSSVATGRRARRSGVDVHDALEAGAAAMSPKAPTGSCSCLT